MKNGKMYTLITGGTDGIGYELAQIFAEEGYNLIIVARDQDELFRTKEELQFAGIEIVTIAKDLFGQEAPFELYDEIKKRGLDVNILVNNAGQGVYGLF